MISVNSSAWTAVIPSFSHRLGPQLGALSLPFFGWEGSPYKNRLERKVGTLILTSLLEDLVGIPRTQLFQ